MCAARERACRTPGRASPRGGWESARPAGHQQPPVTETPPCGFRSPISMRRPGEGSRVWPPGSAQGGPSYQSRGLLGSPLPFQCLRQDR